VPDHDGTAAGEGQQWIRRRGKVRPPRVVWVTDDGSDGSTRSEVASEAPPRERSKPKAKRQVDPGLREGHGEGEREDQGDELVPDLEPPF